MRKWSSRSLRNLRGIHPDLRRVFDRALQESPIDFTVIEGLRTEARQRQLVEQGASTTMNSRHLTGHAVDVMALDANGKGSWAWPLYHKIADAVKAAAVAEGVEVEWGGNWRTFKDGPHFQLSWDRYPKGAPFDPTPPARVAQATKAASENKAGLAGAVSTVAGAAGSVVAASSDAPAPIQWAIAAVIVLGAAAFIYDRVTR